MNLELLKVPAFGGHDGFTARWWVRSMREEPKYRYLQVLLDRIEVARVELDERVYIDHYEGVPKIGDTALEIQFVEVSEKHRLRGIGKAVVDQLVDMHPGRVLVAYSEGADDFWARIGWRPYYHPEKRGPRPRTLFIRSE